MEVDFRQIGKRIAQRRKSLDMTQGKVAELLGVSNNHVSHVEKGTKSLSLEAFINLCDILGVTPNYFLLGSYGEVDGTLISEIHKQVELCDERELTLLKQFVNLLVAKK